MPRHGSSTIVKTDLDRPGSGSVGDYDRSGRHLGKLLTIRRRVGRRVSGVLDLACELQRGGNCRDSDRSITAVEARSIIVSIPLRGAGLLVGHFGSVAVFLGTLRSVNVWG